MKIRSVLLLVMVLVLMNVMVVGAQPAHVCGTITALSVSFDRVDMSGMPFAPRLKEGDLTQFNCIAARDPYFNGQRFDASYKAANYWFGLLGQELGVSMIQLPPPSTP